MLKDQSAVQKKLAALYRQGEERETERLAKAKNLPYVDLRKTPVSLEAVKLIPEEEAKKAVEFR